jgi:c(7)-type cytochrome triheme protein
MISEPTKPRFGIRFLFRRQAGRMLSALILAAASWPSQGQWTLDSKAQTPLGQSPDNWIPLARDQVHDPRGPAIVELQEPGEGLFELPPHQAGNRVLWAKALDRGAISPRRSLYPTESKIQVLDLDVLMDLRGSMPVVRFPHNIHTQWLACDNCHESLFKSRIGETRISMYNILQGEQCGLCHGSVAFPLTECPFCHNVERPAPKWRMNQGNE